MTEQTRLTYLIVVQPELVARDIAMTVADYVPGATIILAPTAAAGVRELAAVDAVDVAFLGMDPDTFAHSDLGRAIRAKGGRAILLSDAADALGKGPHWTALIRPFTTECVIDALDGPWQDGQVSENPPVQTALSGNQRFG